jgi:hypothetical protein
MVAEMVHGVLLPVTGKSPQLAAILREASLQAFDKYPVPAIIGSGPWMESRKNLIRHIDGIALHPPKHVKDIPLQFAQSFYGNMPIHETVRGRDFELIRNHLRVNLLNTHREFNKAAVTDALLADLDRTQQPV